MKYKITAFIVCWRCKRRSKPLRKCTNGFDYICVDCIPMVGTEGPEIANQSKQYIHKGE